MTTRVDRLKRRLLRDLVQQNVDLIRGTFLPSRRPRRGPSLGLAGAMALLLLSTALVGSTRLLTLSSAPRPDAAAAALPVAAAQASGSAPGSFAALRSYRAPGAPALITSAVAPAVAAAVLAPGPPGASPAPSPAGSAGAAGAPEAARTAAVPALPIDSSVLPLAVHKIALDAGHGGDSHGTRTPLGLLEKDITLDIALRLRQLLEAQHGFDIVMTRDDDKAVSLADRAALANRQGADVFLSVHVNWIEDRAARGVETYYLGPTDDPFLNRLAASENRDSGYSMADMRQLLDGIYAGVRQDKSRQLAEMVQAALFRSLGRVNPKIDNRGVKSAPFIVLLSTRMPAILAEVSCLSNAEEARLLARPLYRQYIAEALASGLRAYASAAGGAAGGHGG
jgi:N-acetylmuramoyl-L-alanine amidase